MKKKTAFPIAAFLLATMLSSNPNIVNASGSVETSTTIESERSGENLSIFTGLKKNTIPILSSPMHLGNSNYKDVMLYSGGAYLIYRNDNHIRNWFQQKRTTGSNTIARFGNALPIAGVVYMGGTYFLGNEKKRHNAIIGLESAGSALVATEALKMMVHRHRPSSETERDSFPSSHTAVAFSLATVISHEYGDHKFVTPLAYGMATVTGLSRLNDNRHWASDVLAGGVIGYYAAKTVIKLNANPKSQLKVQPYVDADKVALIIRKNY